MLDVSSTLRNPHLTILLTSCSPAWSDTSQAAFQLFLSIAMYIIPLIIMAIFYVQIAKCLWMTSIPSETSKCLKPSGTSKYLKPSEVSKCLKPSRTNTCLKPSRTSKYLYIIPLIIMAIFYVQIAKCLWMTSVPSETSKCLKPSGTK